MTSNSSTTKQPPGQEAASDDAPVEDTNTSTETVPDAAAAAAAAEPETENNDEENNDAAVAADEAAAAAADEEEVNTPKSNPTSWAQSLLPEFIAQHLVSVDFDALLDETASKSVNELTAHITATKGLAILSIATGVKGSTILLHNIDVVGSLTVALTGAGKMSSIHILDMKKAFKKKNGIRTPLAKFILQNGGEGTDIMTAPTQEADMTVSSIPSSFIIPPWLTRIIFTEELTQVKDILQAAIEYLRDLNIKELKDALHPDEAEATEDDVALSLIDEEEVSGGRILQTLFAWEAANNATSPCTQISISAAVEQHHSETQAAMFPPPAPSHRARELDDLDSIDPPPLARPSKRRKSGFFEQPPTLSSPDNPTMDKLCKTITSLATIQERSLNQAAELQQRKLDGKASIHYTTSNYLKRIGTEDGQSPAPSITPLAGEMVGASKRKHVAAELLLLCLNNDNIRCVTTPGFTEALITGCLTSKKSDEPSHFSPFGVASSFAGTHLEGTDINLLLRRASESKDLTEKEKGALYKSTYIICGTANQLAKVLTIFAAVCKVYLGACSLATLFVTDWRDFILEHEDRIADRTRTHDSDLPAKIQCFVAQTFNDYLEEGRFGIPDDAILNCDSIQRNIIRGIQPLTLIPAINDILHPATSSNKNTNSGAGKAKDGGGGKDSLEFQTHNDKSLKKSRSYYKEVIQKCGLHCSGIPNPMFDEDMEECGKFVFLGSCNNKCKRKKTHTAPTGQRKANLKKFAEDCHKRHKEEKGNTALDFQ